MSGYAMLWNQRRIELEFKAGEPGENPSGLDLLVTALAWVKGDVTVTVPHGIRVPSVIPPNVLLVQGEPGGACQEC